jgi:hypothetical protein
MRRITFSLSEKDEELYGNLVEYAKYISRRDIIGFSLSRAIRDLVAARLEELKYNRPSNVVPVDVLNNKDKIMVPA